MGDQPRFLAIHILATHTQPYPLKNLQTNTQKLPLPYHPHPIAYVAVGHHPPPKQKIKLIKKKFK